MFLLLLAKWLFNINKFKQSSLACILQKHTARLIEYTTALISKLMNTLNTGYAGLGLYVLLNNVKTTCIVSVYNLLYYGSAMFWWGKTANAQ